MCLDLEAFELDHTKITEIGFVIYCGNSFLSKNHYIIKENLDLKNSIHVEDHKFDFMGKSEILTMNEGKLLSLTINFFCLKFTYLSHLQN